MNALPKAANRGDLEAVRKAIAEGAASQGDLDLALGRACCMGHRDVASVLVTAGADPNGR